MTLHRLDTAGRLIPQGARPDTRARHHDPARSWRTGHAYRTWRAKVLTTSDRCVHCGTTGDPSNPLTAGHVLSAKTHPELRLDPSNGQVECRSCNSSRGTH